MRSLLFALVLLAHAGCAGQAEPVQIAVPAGASVSASASASVEPFGPPAAPAACPPGEAHARGTCEPVATAFAAPGGRTFTVDAAQGSDDNDGSAVRPWRTIGRATGADVLQPGDAVVIRAGTYRETVAPKAGGTGPEARVTYAAYPGERVVISGADPADDGWAPAGGGAWRRAWTGEDANPYSDDWHFRRPLVVARGRVLRPVEALRDVVPGTFTVEGPPERPLALVARFEADERPRAAEPIEVAVRPYGFQPEGATPYLECGAVGTPGWLRLVGVTVTHTSNRAQWGAVCAGSEGGLVEDVAVEWTNGAGVDGSGRGHVFRRVRADSNGQIGWVASCTDCLFEDTQAVGNNWKGHDPFWEAGGGKWSETSQTVFRRHYAEGNAGPGLWLDGQNADNTVEGCRLARNEVAGLMLELRTVRTLVQHNVIDDTRWREWSGSGILSQAASGNVIVFNTVVGSEGTGLWLRLDPARRAPDGAAAVADNWIVGNAARASAEAREVSLEAESAEALRSTVFAGNVYGRVGGDPMLRSTFYAAPVGPPFGGEANLRTDALAAWQATVTGDAQASVGAGPPDGRRAVALPRRAAMAGARRAPVVFRPSVGADPALVRTAPR